MVVVEACDCEVWPQRTLLQQGLLILRRFQSVLLVPQVELQLP